MLKLEEGGVWPLTRNATVGAEGSWHLTHDKFLALYIFNYYSNCVFSVILGSFFRQVSSIMYVFDFLNMKFSLKEGGAD